MAEINKHGEDLLFLVLSSAQLNWATVSNFDIICLRPCTEFHHNSRFVPSLTTPQFHFPSTLL